MNTVLEGKIVDTNYDFPVELQPIYLAGNKLIDKKKAVVRTDTNESLGIVSDDYGLVKHATVIDSFREAGKEYGVEEKITLARNGAQLFYQMTFPKIEMEVKKGDLVRMMMIAKNSYNGMNSLQVIFGAFRLVCSNGMILGTQFISFNYKHIGNVGGMIDASITNQYKDAYAQYIKLFGERAPMIQAMIKKPAVGDNLFDPKVTQMPKYLLVEAENSFKENKDQSVWGYYNALTFAVTHKRRNDNQDIYIENGVKAWKMAEGLMN